MLYIHGLESPHLNVKPTLHSRIALLANNVKLTLHFSHLEIATRAPGHVSPDAILGLANFLDTLPRHMFYSFSTFRNICN